MALSSSIDHKWKSKILQKVQKFTRTHRLIFIVNMRLVDPQLLWQCDDEIHDQ